MSSPPNHVKLFSMHKWDARDYQQSSGAQLKWGRELIAKLGLKGAEHVLDIGCGDGKVTAEIASSVPGGYVMGIDSSTEMIATARETFPPDKCRNLRFMVMDALELNFTAKFDVAFSNAVLHWVEDHRSVLKGVHRNLRSPGKILFQMGGRGNAAVIMNIILSLSKKPLWQSYFVDFQSPYHFYGIEEYGNWLKEAGFVARRIELVPKDMTQPGREGLASWLRTTWHPFFNRIDPARQQDFMDQVLDAYLKEYPADAAGLVHMDMVRLEVEAEKP